MTSIRTASYSIEEDMNLCHVYLDVSQDPVIGRYQSKEKFWSRVEAEYHSYEKFLLRPRPVRSLQTRMTTILTAVGKLRGCVNQIQNKNPSGASQEDILNQAKMLLAQDPKYNRGFKFDHVWPILKDIEKFTNDNTSAPIRIQEEDRNFTSPQSYSHGVQSSASASTGMNSFNLNVNDDEITTNLSKRPIGVKKAKEKQKSDDQFKKLMEQNQKLVEVIEKGNSERNEIRRQKVELAKMKEENKILFTDLNSISDPEFRQFIQNEKRQIYKRRAQTSKYGEQTEGSKYQGSQYRASQNQGSRFNEAHREGATDEGQGSETNLPGNFSQYFDYLDETKNDFLNY
ncbi:glutathione S-transferase T3-like [Humulus lupulus]|uniref:glutathione S-transferase T3-like n=1 Tax=Humulus lupulus TaxID=3486 RepID=UPI002B40C3AF|nr:glutathione S-transferase T3-like [Humulus lupulus]